MVPLMAACDAALLNVQNGQLEMDKLQAAPCSAAAGIGNRKKRAESLWAEIKPKMKAGGAGSAGKFAAVQVRELWSDEERVHLHPGHFWVFELGDADGKGSPIRHRDGSPITFEKRTQFEGSRFEKGDFAILIRRYLDRTADDAQGLTFVPWQESAGETLIVNSSELRYVGFNMTRLGGPPQPAGKRAMRGARLLAVPAGTSVTQPVKYVPGLKDDERIRAVCETT
ncbi:hypothetical protein T492DRAFT_969221 [Pavlovales sp. CCMP2436]|nr:hypothetical protein T492DRAFT_969221 [Pavlovales sp. CCMP2436]